MKPAYTLFLSDTHLQVNTPLATVCFLHLMQNAANADAVYILGDLFEYWIGDDDENSFNQQIKSALWQLSQQTAVYFMPGNRDFLINDRFANTTGVKLLDDPSIIDCYGKKVLLMHGDSLCTLDHKHQAFRHKTQNQWYRRSFLALPLWIRRIIANRIRRISYQRGQLLGGDDIMDVCQTTVDEILAEHQPDMLIHGHTHRPATHHHAINDQSITRYVLASWHQHGNALLMSPHQAPQTINIPFTTRK